MKKFAKPNLFRHHDYRAFLLEVINSGKKTKSGFSLRSLCRDCKISVSYFSMVLNGKRDLTDVVLEKIQEQLQLNAREWTYFKLLMILSDSKEVDARLKALEQLQKFAEYQNENTKELEAFRYLTKWYYVAIRELATLPSFSGEVAWIQSSLSPKITPREIREALEFLTENGFLILGNDGKLKPAKKTVDCLGGVYRLSLAQFHKQMFEHAINSIHQSTREERMILGHTFCVSKAGHDKISQLLTETLQKVQEIEAQDRAADRLYHLSLAAFPLSPTIEVLTANQKGSRDST